MLFNSFDFLFFFPIVTIVYYLLRQNVRWFWLLAASCYFYMFFVPVYILVLAGTIVIDYFVGIYLEKVKLGNKRTLLVISIIANVGILAVFKYYNFFIDNITTTIAWLGWNHSFKYLGILLPIGLSFHTFQAMSYTIEVYRGNQKAEKHFGIYALYVMFYPQLVAGPIERPQNVLHQFHERKPFIPENISLGLKLMLWGLFKKVVVADRLAQYVDAVFDNYNMHHGSSLMLAAFFFSIQIYCDFSGYSDIALGTAKTLGYDLMPNFQRPYFATSISHFWRRWHISLSTWFRDYLYIPLGGNRVSSIRVYLNLFIVFVISGFWHGANWTFIIWGALHGFFNTVNLIYGNLKGKLKGSLGKCANLSSHPILSIPFTFCFVTLAWIIFRAKNANVAWAILNKIVTDPTGDLFLKTGAFNLFAFTGIAILFFKELKDEQKWNIHLLSNKHPIISKLIAVMLIVLIILVGVLDNAQFIYFQF